MNKKYLIIYHSDDADGRVSAALIWCWLNGINAEHKEQPSNINYMISSVNTDNIACLPNGGTAYFMGSTYASLASMTKACGGPGALLEDWKRHYTDIIITDISFNDVEMMRLLYKEYNNRVVWFDHHAPAIKSSEENGYGNMRGSRATCTSAIMLVWHWLYGHMESPLLSGSMKNAPRLLRALAGYDSWAPKAHGVASLDLCDSITRGFDYITKESLSGVIKKAAQIAMLWLAGREYIIMDDRAADSLRKQELDMFTECENAGDIVVKAKSRMWRRSVDEYGDFTWTVNGARAVALFMQAPCNSRVFAFLKDSGVKHAIVLRRYANSGAWAMSVYNINDDDETHLGEYLKSKYGGGGHKGAGGATLTEAAFAELMKTHNV